MDLSAKVIRRPPQFGNKRGQQNLFQARETLRLVCLTLQHANFLPQQQNLDVFLSVKGGKTSSEGSFKRRRDSSRAECRREHRDNVSCHDEVVIAELESAE